MFRKLYLLFKLLQHLHIEESHNGFLITFNKDIRVDIQGDLRSNANCYYFNCDVGVEEKEDYIEERRVVSDKEEERCLMSV